MPTNLHSFTVEGTGRFPFDMLRYDSCWPASQIDVTRMTDADYSGTRRVNLHSHKAPSPERWDSFRWTILEHQKRRV